MSEAMAPVAFLGLGALGAPMAANLLKAGFPLAVHNRTRHREEALAACGARRAATPKEAASQGRIVCLCLSDDAAVEEVLFAAEDGPAIEGLQAGALVVDFSTIAPATSEAVAARLASRRVTYIDAPVTGGTEGAKAGSLAVLVGGDPADLERARPLLEVVGRTISHFGPVGSGQRVKAVNQVLVAGSYGAVAEAIALGRRLGLPMEQVVEALQGGAAGSWALSHRAASMLAGNFPLGFKLALHRKDLAIALEAAASSGLELPLTRQVAAMEEALMDAGHGQEDVSGLLRWFEIDADVRQD